VTRNRLLAACAVGAASLAFFWASMAPTPSAIPRTHLLAWRVALGSLALAFLALAAALAGRGPVRSALGLVRPRAQLGTVILLCLGGLGLSQLADLAIAAFTPDTPVGIASFRRTVHRLGASSPAAPPASATTLVTALVLLPAVAEELLFRGWMLCALRKQVASSTAIAICALLFGTLHGDWLHGSAAAALGLYFGTVVVATGSVWPAIACHLVNNVAAFAFAWSPPPRLPSNAILTASSLVALAGAFALLAGLYRRRPELDR